MTMLWSLRGPRNRFVIRVNKTRLLSLIRWWILDRSSRGPRIRRHSLPPSFQKIAVYLLKSASYRLLREWRDSFLMPRLYRGNTLKRQVMLQSLWYLWPNSHQLHIEDKAQASTKLWETETRRSTSWANSSCTFRQRLELVKDATKKDRGPIWLNPSQEALAWILDFRQVKDPWQQWKPKETESWLRSNREERRTQLSMNILTSQSR